MWGGGSQGAADLRWCRGGGGGKRHTMPHSAQSQHANYWAPGTRKRHQQEHRPQRPTERSDPTQHAKGRTGDRPGPRKGATTRRNVTQGPDTAHAGRVWGAEQSHMGWVIHPTHVGPMARSRHGTPHTEPSASIHAGLRSAERQGLGRTVNAVGILGKWRGLAAPGLRAAAT